MLEAEVGRFLEEFYFVVVGGAVEERALEFVLGGEAD